MMSSLPKRWASDRQHAIQPIQVVWGPACECVEDVCAGLRNSVRASEK
jgi:hypothetical protein